MPCGHGSVERECPTLGETADDDTTTGNTSGDLSLDKLVDILSSGLHPGLVLWTIGVETLEVEPGWHLEAGVKSDGHLVGAGTHQLDTGRLDGGDGRGPTITAVTETVKKDHCSRVLLTKYVFREMSR